MKYTDADAVLDNDASYNKLNVSMMKIMMVESNDINKDDDNRQGLMKMLNALTLLNTSVYKEVDE